MVKGPIRGVFVPGHRPRTGHPAYGQQTARQAAFSPAPRVVPGRSSSPMNRGCSIIPTVRLRAPSVIYKPVATEWAA